MNNAGFTYRFDRLKHRASKFRGPPAKVYIFLTLLLDFHTCAVITYCTVKTNCQKNIATF